MNDKLTRLSAWIGRDDERRERERELPRAVCRVCGGTSKAGEGTREAEPFKGLMPLPSDPTRAILVTPSPAPENADDWRRTCTTCATATPGELVGAVLGVDVRTADATRVFGRMRSFDEHDRLLQSFPTAEVVGHGTGRPWGHLRNEHRDEVKRVLREVIADRLPGISRWGACGLCGRRESLRWTEGPVFLRWPDGSRAPVCRECQEVVNRRPEVSNVEELRVVGVEIATGHAQMYYTAPGEFRLYFESRDCDGNGYPEPWVYSPGIIAFQEEMWTASPKLAPEDRREEFTERNRARFAEAEREAQKRAEAEHTPAW